KIEAEDLVAAFCPEHQIPYTIVRPAIVKAIQKRRFIVIPGKMARLVYCGHRLTLGLTTRFTSDRVIRYVQAKRRR
ncbi:MAG: hypothetical protein HZB24_15935, partial [Desulfobacterales bacterium]|nr:hypothetical protein [Desulfobacterales bacterium]